MSTRAGIYVRVSTDKQRDYGYSIDNQIRNLEKYCHKNDYEIIGMNLIFGQRKRKEIEMVVASYIILLNVEMLFERLKLYIKQNKVKS